MESLKAVCEENKVQALAGFGKNRRENIRSNRSVGSRPERLPIAMVLPIAGNRGEIVEYC